MSRITFPTKVIGKLPLKDMNRGWKYIATVTTQRQLGLRPNRNIYLDAERKDMRELKFRAWDRIKNEMYHNIFLDTYCHWKDNGICIENLEIMQSTGLKDRNGVDIYEGDIYHQGDKNILYLVEWHDYGFKGSQIGTNKSYAGLQFHQRFIEVIGNIWQNPELLNPRQDG